MRLLYLGWGFSPFRTGGSLRYAESVMKAMVARGHEVAYFCAGRYSLPPRQKATLREWTRDGIRHFEVVDSPILPTWGLGTRHPGREVACPPLRDLLARVVDDFRPDLVHAHELNLLSADLVGYLKSRGLPVAISLHDFGPLCPTFFLYRNGAVCRDGSGTLACADCSGQAPADTIAYRLALGVQSLLGSAALRALARPASLAKAFFRRQAAGLPVPASDAGAFARRRSAFLEALSAADLLLPVSGRVAEIYRESGVKGPEFRVLNPLLPHHDGIHPPASRPSLAGRKAVFGYIGVLMPPKGLEVLLAAHAGMSQRDQIELRLYGTCDPAYRQRLTRRFPAGMAGYRGAFDATGIQGVLDGVDVGLFPSVCEETYGLVAVEFQQAGIPVIASRTGGVPDIVQDGVNGLLVEPGDVDALAAAMDRVASEAGLVEALSSRAHRFGPFDGHVSELEGICAGLLKKG